MRRPFPEAILAALLVAGWPAAAAEKSVITQPDWLHLPTGEDMARVYPEIAQHLEMEGYAVISCTVNDMGQLTVCERVAEAPKDLGFGHAARQLGPMFRIKPMTVNGQPVGGATVRIPIRFRLPEPKIPPAPATHPVAERAPAMALELVDLTKSVADIVAGFDQLALHVERDPSPGVPTSTRTVIAEGYRRAVREHADEIREAQARAYAETFSADELAQIVAFERTSAGVFLRSTSSDRAVASGLARNLIQRVATSTREEFCRSWECDLQASVAASGATLRYPVWAEEPTELQRQARAPLFTRLFGGTGFVRLRCTLAEQERPERCEVEAEAPAELGYGAAALSLAQFYRLDLANFTQSAADQTVAVEVMFTPPNLPSGLAIPQHRSEGAMVLARQLAKGDGQLTDFHRRMARPFQGLLREQPPGVSGLAFERLKAAFDVAVADAAQAWVEERASLIAGRLTEVEIAQAVAFVESPAGRAWWERPKAVERRAAIELSGVASRIIADVRAAFCRDRDCQDQIGAKPAASTRTP